VQLVGQFEGVKHLHGIGTDIDAGAEFGELGRLLVDLNLEALPAKRDAGRQTAQAGSYDSDPTRASHVAPSRFDTVDRHADRRHPISSWDGCAERGLRAGRPKENREPS
jgi:hypothetical protein